MKKALYFSVVGANEFEVSHLGMCSNLFSLNVTFRTEILCYIKNHHIGTKCIEEHNDWHPLHHMNQGFRLI